MKEEVTLVPKDKCPLDVLAEMGERTKDCWIFLHGNAVEKLQHSDGVQSKTSGKHGIQTLTWEATEDYPETKIVIDICGLNAEWSTVISISASDIAFTICPLHPKNVFFLQMAE